jgi:acetyl esterase/lipase
MLPIHSTHTRDGKTLTRVRKATAWLLIMLCVSAALTAAQSPATARWASDLGSRYWVQPDIVYHTASGHALALDVYYQHDSKTPGPTLVYIHGGGWIFGDKATAVLQFVPYLEMGWTVVSVEYRMASTSQAPAAVEDCRCALRWVLRNTTQYNIDPRRIVLSGHSAGGHLALTTGMLPAGTGLDNQCYGDEELKVAAIVNWYGITDVADLLHGANLKNYALMWLGSQANADEVARRVSPLSYVRENLPPILTIHGDKDDVVPYGHAVRLHKALDQARVRNRLMTIAGGGHGGFNEDEFARSFAAIREFLAELEILRADAR